MRTARLHIRAAASELTDAELNVLELVAEGMRNEEIGARLFMARDTVKDHLRTARLRLGAVNQAHAVAQAHRRRLLPRRPVAPAEPFPVTAAELEVLALVAEGLTNEQVADARLVSAETVKSQVESLLLKLPALNRAHAVAVAYETGLLQDDPSRGGSSVETAT